MMKTDISKLHNYLVFFQLKKNSPTRFARRRINSLWSNCPGFELLVYSVEQQFSLQVLFYGTDASRVIIITFLVKVVHRETCSWARKKWFLFALSPQIKYRHFLGPFTNLDRFNSLLKFIIKIQLHIGIV